jgi:two-component system, OmpR family, sensor kinase
MIPAFKSIRWRLQAWHGLLLLAVLAAFGSTAYYLALENRLRRVDQELQRRAAILLSRSLSAFAPGEKRGWHFRGEPPSGMEEGRKLSPKGGGRPEFPLDLGDGPGPDEEFRQPGEMRRPGGPRAQPLELRLSAEEQRLFEGGSPEGFYFKILTPDGNVSQQSTNAPAHVPFPLLPRSPSASLLRTRGELRELAQTMPRDLCLIVGRDVSSEHSETQRLAGWLGGAGAGVLLLGLAGGWWLTTRALRPIADISATAVKIAGGDLSQRIGAENAETELGQLAGVLDSTFDRLEAAFAQQVRFTSDAAHELRTPITVMLTQTQTALARERTPVEYRETLEACQRASVRMRKLIESLLELARLDAGQEPLPRAPFDLAQVAAECLENLRPMAADGRIELQADLAEAGCHGNPERIAQVITNLLANAIHYNRERGSVHLKTYVEQGGAVLTVADTGMGINPADLPHIFERFYRADKARSRAGGHAGLGLSISKAIVDAHGGTLSATSQPGEGTVFTMRLPAMAAAGKTAY